MANAKNDNANTKLVKKLFLITVGMFGFGFAMVPMYDVICDITGLNGKTSGRYTAELEQSAEQLEERQITVQFLAQNNEGMSWAFRANDPQVKVKPGEVKVVSYQAKNVKDYAMTGQAIPSVAPNEAAQYLKKIECFCFAEQDLAPGEEVEMALRFFVDKDIPKHITKLTLSYSLFDITKEQNAAESVAVR
ncbi:MAG: cytochrome c oxidase assembly protein [Pseudohongiellaceae bacterium]|nr:cytochrome c oxidase assembly protein [Pseudohongiellaceae bacterium]